MSHLDQVNHGPLWPSSSRVRLGPGKNNILKKKIKISAKDTHKYLSQFSDLLLDGCNVIFFS